MFTFFRDLFLWIWKKIVYIFLPVIGWTVWLYENISQIYMDCWEWVFSSIKWYITDFYLWLFGKLTEMISTFFADNDFIVGVVEFSNDTFLAINVFLPLNETMVCIMLIITTMISVFLIRIILKAVPQIW